MNDTLDVMLDDRSLGPLTKVGTLSRESKRANEVISFAYDAGYLAQAWCVALDPELPLHPGRQYPTAPRSLFGVFRDTAPDRWGRVLMERREAHEAKHAGRPRHRLTEWDFLTGVSDSTRLGALRLCEIGPIPRFIDDGNLTVPPFARLRELERIALDFDREDAEYEQWLVQLIAPGSSLGGARPKASVVDESGQLWLAKFPASDDRHDVGAWEAFAAALARTAGIDTSDHRLLKLTSRYHTYAVKRFDRDGDARRLYASAMTLLCENDGAQRSYIDIAEAIQMYGDPACIEVDLAQLYRRIAFSILVANRDDHLRNHGFLRVPNGWRLSPVFDVNPSPYKADHALAIDEDDPTPSIAHLHGTHPYYRLTAAAATRMEDEVRAAVRDWPRVATFVGISAAEQRQLADIIDPDAS